MLYSAECFNFDWIRQVLYRSVAIYQDRERISQYSPTQTLAQQLFLGFFYCIDIEAADNTLHQVLYMVIT